MSGERPATMDHLQKQSGGHPVRIPVISSSAVAGQISCNCGWVHRGARKSKREEAAQKHLDKKHNGYGVWL